LEPEDNFIENLRVIIKSIKNPISKESPEIRSKSSVSINFKKTGIEKNAIISPITSPPEISPKTRFACCNENSFPAIPQKTTLWIYAITLFQAYKAKTIIIDSKAEKRAKSTRNETNKKANAPIIENEKLNFGCIREYNCPTPITIIPAMMNERGIISFSKLLRNNDVDPVKKKAMAVPRKNEYRKVQSTASTSDFSMFSIFNIVDLDSKIYRFILIFPKYFIS
jgi:hypothetical protein